MQEMEAFSKALHQHPISIPLVHAQKSVEYFFSQAVNHRCNCKEHQDLPELPSPPSPYNIPGEPWPEGAKDAWEDGLKLPCPACNHTLSAMLIAKGMKVAN